MKVMPKAKALEIAHTLSDPAKMPGKSYSLPTNTCKTGVTLREIPGSVCSKCYADNRGNYRFENVKSALSKRHASILHPQWAKAMVTLIIGEEWFRWHDSGDLQSLEHFNNIVEVAHTLEQTNFWLPTKERSIIADYANRLPDHGDVWPHRWPSNLTVRWSMPMLDQAPDLEKLAKSTAVSPYLRYSMVSTKVETQEDLEGAGLPADTFFVCEARQRDNNCGYCRACWDDEVPVIVYPFH